MYYLKYNISTTLKLKLLFKENCFLHLIIDVSYYFIFMKKVMILGALESICGIMAAFLVLNFDIRLLNQVVQFIMGACLLVYFF